MIERAIECAVENVTNGKIGARQLLGVDFDEWHLIPLG